MRIDEGTRVIGVLVVSLALLVVVASLALAIPIYLWLATGQVPLPGLIGGIAFAAAVVGVLRPFQDRFEAPGPALTAGEHPQFFAMLRDLAAELGQAPPEDVYLLPEANAWAMYRGGFLGFGARPVLALGLPLLGGMNRAQLIAIIAHELGHFDDDGTRHSARLYRLRGAVARIVASLRERGGPLYVPLRGFLLRLLRVTRERSRRQEFHADRVAARLAGPATAERALRRLAGLAAAWDAYFGPLYAPILESGKAPPVLAGFAAYLAEPSVSEVLEEQDALGVEDEAAHPYATHPSAAERIRAFRAMDLVEPGLPAGPALELFDGGKLEAELARIFGRSLAAIAWDDVVPEILVPWWARQLTEVDTDGAPAFEEVAALLAGKNPDATATTSEALLEVAVLLVLARAGVRHRYRPLSGTAFRLGGAFQDADRLLAALARGRMPQRTWRALVERAGLAGRRLYEVGAFALPPPSPPPIEALAGCSRRRLLNGPPGWLVLAAVPSALAAGSAGRPALAVLATLIAALGLLAAIAAPWLTRTRLRLEDGVLRIQRFRRTHQVAVEDIHRLRLWYRDRPREFAWTLVLESVDGRRLRVLHSSQQDDDQFEVLGNALLQANYERLLQSFERGDVLPAGRGVVLSRSGLGLGGTLLPWSALAKPRINDEVISVFRRDDPEPCLVLPPSAPDQRAIAGLITNMTEDADIAGPHGLQVYSGRAWLLAPRERAAAAALAVLPLAILGRPDLAWPIAGLLSPLMLFVLHRLSARVTVFEKAVSERTLFGIRTVAAADVTEVIRDAPHQLTVRGVERGRTVRVRLPMSRPQTFEFATRALCFPLIDRWLGTIEADDQVHWCEGTWIRSGDIADAHSQLSVLLDDTLRLERSADQLLVFSIDDPGDVIALPLDAPNLLVGQRLLEDFLKEMETSAPPESDDDVQDEAPAVGPGTLGADWRAQAPQDRVAALQTAYPMPTFLADYPCPVHGIYEDLPKLAEHGQVVWGAIVQAHEDLFLADAPEPRLAALVYGDRRTSATGLRAVADRLFKVKGRLMRLEDEASQHFADLLQDELEQHLRLPVPSALAEDAAGEAPAAGSDPFVYTTGVVHPDQLPTGRLADGLLPLIIAPAQTDAVVILPEPFWPPTLRDAWFSEGQPAREQELTATMP